MLGDRPLVIYDLETTGLDKSKDQIIQIALVKYDWNIKKIIDSKNYYIFNLFIKLNKVNLE